MICVLIKTKIYCYTEKQKLEPMLKKHRKKEKKKLVFIHWNTDMQLEVDDVLCDCFQVCNEDKNTVTLFSHTLHIIYIP